MKLNRSALIAFIILLVAASLYRIIPNRPAGFAPQLAMALLGGAMIKDKKWAMIIPLFSLFISDLLYHFLYITGLTPILGFYEGQWAIYVVFILLTLFGSLMKRASTLNIAAFSVAGSVIFFLLSNFITWKTGWGFGRPQTIEGLMMCYGDAIAYFRQAGIIPGFAGNFILGDLIWSFGLFGCYFLVTKLRAAKLQIAR
jgi:hypothetical protein